MIYSVSSESTTGIVSFACLQYIGCWLWTDQCSGYLFTGYLFPALFANQILICFMPAATCADFVIFAFMVCWLTLNKSLFRFYCIWQCQEHLYIGVILQYTSGSMAATLNVSPFKYVYFSLGYCVFTSF